MLKDTKGQPPVYYAHNLNQFSHRSKSTPGQHPASDHTFTPDPSLATFSIMHQMDQQRQRAMDQYLSPSAREALSIKSYYASRPTSLEQVNVNPDTNR